MNIITQSILAIFFIPLIVILVTALPYTLRPYDVSSMPKFPAEHLKAGDLVLTRWKYIGPSRFIGFWTHVFICYEKDGILYTTEARPEWTTDVLTGKKSQTPTKLPEDSIKKYPGIVCVRRLKKALSIKENARLLKAVESRYGSEYDSLFFASFWLSMTKYGSIVAHDNRYFCSDYITSILNDVRIRGVREVIPHPLLKTPAMFGTKFESILGFTNVGPILNELYEKEAVPVFDS